MALTPRQRSLRARVAAHTLHSQGGAPVNTEAARAAFLASFERGVDPGGVPPEAERKRRAEHALKAHMARLALASSKARAARAAERFEGGAAWTPADRSAASRQAQDLPEHVADLAALAHVAALVRAIAG